MSTTPFIVWSSFSCKHVHKHVQWYTELYYMDVIMVTDRYHKKQMIFILKEQLHKLKVERERDCVFFNRKMCFLHTLLDVFEIHHF